MRIDLQLNPATSAWPEVRDGARAAEAAGFDTVWVFDHLSGTSLRGHTMLECFTLLGALAASTTSVGLGTMVVNVANRPAGVTAVAVATAQAISGGRLRLGLGAGAAPGTRWSAEHAALGIPLRPTMAARHEAVADLLDLLDAAWAPGSARAARFDGVPRPDPRPPVVLGVNSEPLARLAGARTDGVNVRGDHPDLARLLAAADGARTDRTAPWEASVWAFHDEALLRSDHPARVRWAGLGVTRLVLTSLAPMTPAAVEAAGRLLRP